MARQLFDGRLAIPLAHPYADVNLPIAGAGHSRVLTDPAHVGEWGRRILPAATAGSRLVGQPEQGAVTRGVASVLAQ